MTPTFKEYVFDVAELKLLSIVCEKCGAEVIIDISVSDTKARIPRGCPSCGDEFAPLFYDGLNSFLTAYSKLTASEKPHASARIRIRREVNFADF